MAIYDYRRPLRAILRYCRSVLATSSTRLIAHQHALAQCRRCTDMQGKPVYGYPNASAVMLIGQAPGIKEMEVNRPFAWTAGKTLFKWFAELGISENDFRERVYMAAVCRCFPGKNPKGGDRVPNLTEIGHCAPWLRQEIALLRPALLIPVGKLAINQFLSIKKLDEIIGHQQRVSVDTTPNSAPQACDLIALPHPSGASTWHRTQPGMDLLQRALSLIGKHPAWRSLLS